MRPIRSGGRADARRVRHTVSIALVSGLFAAAPLLAAELSGTVVDPHGRPVPRAHVRIVEPGTGAGDRGQPSDTFSDEGGRFTIDAAGSNCRVEVTLAGFRTTAVPCAVSPLRIELPLAPVEETVIVTATRTEAPASQTGLSTTTFTAADIERRQSPLVSDLLRSSPGATVLQMGGPGGVTSLFTRGGESNYNLVFLDGVPLNEPGGTFNFNNLTTENLERIEVVRGANSSLFGSDAMSSVVQLFTRRGTNNGAPRATAQLDGGTYATMHANASVAGATRAWDYSLGVARFSTDNRGPNAAFDNNTLSADLGGPVAGSATLRAVARAELGRSGTPGQTAYGRPDLDAYFEHHDIVAGVTFDQPLTPSLRQRATYSLSTSNQASVNRILDPPYTPSFAGHVAPFEFSDFRFDAANKLRRHYASYQADWRVAGGGTAGDHLLTLLADWNGERATLEDRLANTSTTPSRDNVGASLQHQLLWRRLSTTAGLRVEHNHSFGTAVVPRGSLVLTVHDGSGALGNTRVRAAGGGGIKEPTLLQSFSTSPFFHGNPDLQPERSRAVEAGLEQRFASDRVKVDVTWFDNRYRNIIGLQSTGGFKSEYINIGLTRARGTELSAEAVPQSSLHLRGGYTFLDSEIVQSTSPASTVFAAGNWAFRRPRHSGFVEATWSWRRFTADINGVLIGRFVDSDFSSLVPSIDGNPGRTTWNARASYAITSRVTGLLTIDNVTDREYQEPLGYPALRRAVRVGVRVGL